MVNTRQACSITPLAKRNKLVNRYHAAKPDARFDLTVSADLGIVADNDLVLKHAVMPQLDLIPLWMRAL